MRTIQHHHRSQGVDGRPQGRSLERRPGPFRTALQHRPQRTAAARRVQARLAPAHHPRARCLLLDWSNRKQYDRSDTPKRRPRLGHTRAGVRGDWNGWQYPPAGPIPWAEISKGFLHQGERIHFAGRALGIFKPRQMTAALSVRTAMPRAGRPTWYRDQRAELDVETGLLPYDLARKSASHTNTALELAHRRRAPLIYFRAVRPALYEAIFPVWVGDFRADEGRVLLAAQSPARGDAVPDEWPQPYASIGERERSYSLRAARRRNHQAWFSKHVRSVYGYRCAFSNLPLGKLLVGAHIKADDEGGPASVSNGICMSTAPPRGLRLLPDRRGPGPQDPRLPQHLRRRRRPAPGKPPGAPRGHHQGSANA